MIEQLADQLQRHVFERQGRTVEQLLHPVAMIDLHQRVIAGCRKVE